MPIGLSLFVKEHIALSGDRVAQGLSKSVVLGFRDLAQLLGTLGEHLDSKKSTAFKISWSPDSVSVEYQTANGVSERKDFTVESLRQLALKIDP